MFKLRIYSTVILITIVFCYSLLFDIKSKNTLLVEAKNENDSNQYISNVKTSYIPEPEQESLNIFLLELNTCFPNKDSSECLYMVSEKPYKNLQNCENQKHNISQEITDLISDGIKVKYFCRAIDNDIVT